MRLNEVANSVERRRIEILKNNAERAQRQVKDAIARAKIKKAQDDLLKSRTQQTGKSMLG